MGALSGRAWLAFARASWPALTSSPSRP